MGITLLLGMYLAAGALLSLLAIPLIQGKVARNGLYGFRVPKTLASDSVWFPANRFMGRDLLRCGILLMIGTLLMLLLWRPLGLGLLQVAYTELALIVVLTIAMVFRSFMYLRTL